MHKAETETPDPPPPVWLSRDKILQRDPDDRRSNQRFDDAVRYRHNAQRSDRQRYAVSQGEGRDDAHHRPQASRSGEERHQEQQMVIAGENVLDTEPDEVEPARRCRAVDVYTGGPRCLPEGHLALAARRADI